MYSREVRAAPCFSDAFEFVEIARLTQWLYLRLATLGYLNSGVLAHTGLKGSLTYCPCRRTTTCPTSNRFFSASVSFPFSTFSPDSVRSPRAVYSGAPMIWRRRPNKLSRLERETNSMSTGTFICSSRPYGKKPSALTNFGLEYGCPFISRKGLSVPKEELDV